MKSSSLKLLGEAAGDYSGIWMGRAIIYTWISICTWRDGTDSLRMRC